MRARLYQSSKQQQHARSSTGVDSLENSAAQDGNKRYAAKQALKRTLQPSHMLQKLACKCRCIRADMQVLEVTLPLAGIMIATLSYMTGLM